MLSDCLHAWLKRGKSVGGYISLGVLLLMLCVLPAGAWLAAGIASAYIGWMHYRSQIMAWFSKHKVLTIGAFIALSFALGGVYLLFKLYDGMPEGKYVKGRKEWTARMVLEKEPKVQSTAIREMREEVRKRMKK